MANHDGDHADLMVISGITGDLARRMTFRALYRLERRDLLYCPVVGVASQQITADELAQRARTEANCVGSPIAPCPRNR
jgi:glucose-6-phosphate 1-dehydrogenase